MKTILFFMSGYSWAEVRYRDAVFLCARAQGWRIQCVPYVQAAASRYHLPNCSVACDVRGLIEFWRPDGCLVECGAAPRHLQPADFRPVPVVFLDREPETLAEDASYIAINAMQLARRAFDELSLTGIRQFAYARWRDPLPWNVKRERAFAQVLAEHGLGMHVLETGTAKGMPRSSEGLLRDIRALPHPVAVFAANDLVGEQIVSVCHKGGLSVPGDVVVLGVDNAEDVCENAVVSLSSLAPDHAGAGRQACALLARQMETSPSTPVSSATFGVASVVRRASTQRANTDARVLKALEFIRQNATFSRSVEDVVRAMGGCSRRTADLLFKAQVGQSILGHMTDVRVARVQEMLRAGDKPISVVSDMCGFTSVNDLDRVFRQRTGLTPTAWRKRTIA